MKTGKSCLRQHPCLRLLVLVPHRDARLPLRAWSASLFAAGLPGAWSFPWIIPLAAVKRPYPGEALKSLAHSLRRHIDRSGGKFIASTPAAAVFPGSNSVGTTVSVFGPALNTALPADFCLPEAEELIAPFSPLVIGSALIGGSLPPSLPPVLPQAPQISFRAAALANMVFRPLLCSNKDQDNFSFEWNIGPLHWLPKTIKS